MTWYEVVFDRRRLLVNEDYTPLQKKEKSCWEILVSADCVLPAVTCFVWCGQKQFGTDRKIDEVIRRIRDVATQLRELKQSRNLSRDRTLESHRMVWLKRKVMVTVTVRSLLWEEEEEEREELFFLKFFTRFLLGDRQTDTEDTNGWRKILFFIEEKNRISSKTKCEEVLSVFSYQIYEDKKVHIHRFQTNIRYVSSVFLRLHGKHCTGKTKKSRLEIIHEYSFAHDSLPRTKLDSKYKNQFGREITPTTPTTKN